MGKSEKESSHFLYLSVALKKKNYKKLAKVMQGFQFSG